MEIGSANDWVKSSATTVKSPSGIDGRATASMDKAPASVASEQVTDIRGASVASPERIREAVDNIQEFVQSVRRDINFSLDESSGRVVVKVTDGRSGDVIRQIPSEEALKLAESLSEARSLLFTAQV